MIKLIHGADLHLDSPFSGLTPEQAAARRQEQRELLERCLAHLPQREIDLLNYYYILELPYKEIARLTGLTAENARMIVCRAKKKVLAAYREKGGKADE